MIRDERYLRAMGSDVHLVAVGPDAVDPGQVLTAMVAELDRLERRWSRFQPDSDVSRLARAGGTPLRVDPATVLLVQRMLEAHARLDGWYDPTVLDLMLAHGYDRDLAALPPSGGGPSVAAAATAAAATARVPAAGLGDVVCTADEVRLPPGVGLDPGAIGKGLAGDLLVAVARRLGATGVLVNLGGDVRVAGLDDRGAAWGVVVADDAAHGAPTGPGAGPDGVLLGLTDAAVVTSTVRRRRWTGPDGTTRHHLMDPHAGAPTRHDLVTVTVVAAEGWWADAAATAVLAAGPAGIGLAIDLALSCRLTFVDGTMLPLGGFDARVLDTAR